MKRLIWPACAVLAALLCAEISNAQTCPEGRLVVYEWVNPTSYTNGAPIRSGELVNIALLYDTTPSALESSQNMAIVDPVSPQSVCVPEGEWYGAGRALTSNGEFSELSNLDPFVVTRAANSPTDLNASPPIEGPLVTVAESAYVITQSTDYLGTDYVGTVPVGTPCNPEVGANGYYAVPQSAVDALPDVFLDGFAVLAECARSD